MVTFPNRRLLLRLFTFGLFETVRIGAGQTQWWRSRVLCGNLSGMIRVAAFYQYHLRAALVCVLFGSASLRLEAQSSHSIYTDTLQNGWVDWSWATVNRANSSPVHSGSSSISVSSTNWQALYLHHSATNGSDFTNLTFWINGGASGGQIIQIQATRINVPQPAVVLAPLPVNSWRLETISLTSLGVATATDFDGFWLQVQNSGLAPTFYVDDIALVTVNNPAVNTNTVITVNAGVNHRSISPLIYGVAYASSNELKQLNAPLNRQGGNPTSRYNWQINADNRAFDYFFASIAYPSATPGEHGDSFIRDSRNGGAEPSLTIPMLDWVARLGPARARTWSYSVAKYGAQQDVDNEGGWPDMGNGIRPNGSLIVTNDPNDANVLAGPAFQQGWLNHLTNTWGRATNGGLRYYHLDNEMGIWHSTHQDVHPAGATMSEMRDKMTNYAARIKLTDPGALVLGPEEWHFYGAIFSGADAQYESTNGYPGIYPDRAAHGGSDVYPYLLGEMARASTNAGRRLLDVCTIHYYPQGGEFGNDVTAAMQLRRNRSTRSLWDTNYVDESWLADNSLTRVVKLIPRLKGWVTTNFPGTLIGMTEYNWGAENHINGATAQADVLGIFGREGLDLAERWTTPPSGSVTFKAMQMYRNYDGNKSTFGDTSVSATGPNPDNVSAFAALRSTDGALTLMAINKQLSNVVPVSIVLTNFLPGGTAKIWRLNSANVISNWSDITFTGSAFSNTLPAQSITLFVLAAGSPPHLRVGPMGPGNTFNFWLEGQPGQRYAILSSSNLMNWSPVQTNLLTTNSFYINLPATDVARFYRAHWVP